MNTSTTFKPSVFYHPGETLKEKLTELNMSVKEFAVRVSKPEKTIYAVINGNSSVTPEMAVAFENVTKILARFWLNEQRLYDEYIARMEKEKLMCTLANWAKQFPLKAMKQMGWISYQNNNLDKVNTLLSFFQFSSEKAWENYYFNQQLKVTFRISLSTTKDPYAISAWLRQGEIQASNIHAVKYSKQALIKILPDIKNLCYRQPDDFKIKLQTVLATAGVKIIFTPSLPKAPISGATRWINNSPCVQLSGRYKRNDIFWFTLFHEIGHILLHGKKEVFLEDVECENIQQDKETEADSFASDILLSKINEQEIVDNANFTKEAISMYAEKFKIHTGIIVGRLQHRGLLSYSQYTGLFAKVNLFDN